MVEELDEEVYSTIFNALRHGVRRNILRMLEEREHSFTDMEEKLGLSSSHLTYHLDSLKELITKTEIGYKLSVFGRAAVEMMSQVESPPKRYNEAQGTQRKVLMVILIVGLCSSLLGLAYYVRLNNLLQSKIASVSYDILVDDMGLSFSLLRSSYTSILDSGKLDYYNVKQLLYQLHQLRSQCRLLKTMDSRHHQEWFELDFTVMELWHFFQNLEQKLLQDQNLDLLELTEEQIELMVEMRETLNTIMSITETEYQINTKYIEIDESTLEESLQASNYLLELIEDGYEVFKYARAPRDVLLEKARAYIVEHVGEEYFDRYFTYWGFEECTTEDWRYRVGFFYNIQVGNYTEISEVCLWYDSTLSMIRYTAVPSADNLMPFNVTREEAIDIAIKEAGSIGWVDVDVVIHYCDELLDGTPFNKYVWVVGLYLNPREAMTGSLLSIIIDPHSGTVIESERISWHSTP